MAEQVKEESKEVETDKGAFEQIVGGIEMPSVSEHVIEKELEKEKETSLEPPSNEENNELFNPDLHAVDKFGKPITTKSGKFRKKSGRKKGVDYSKKEQTQPNTPNLDSQLGVFTQDNSTYTQETTAEPSRNPDSVLVAKTATAMLDKLRHLLSDLKAENEELEYLETAWYEWAEYSGATINPNFGVVLASGLFMLPALNQKKTLSITQKIGRFFGGFFRKKRVHEQKEKSDHIKQGE